MGRMTIAKKIEPPTHVTAAIAWTHLTTTKKISDASK